MAEQQPNPAEKKWTIEGTGVKPSLSFRVYRNAILDSEKGDEWTEDNPQPKYQYVFDVTYTSWAEMFEAVVVSTGWKIGDDCRKGLYTPNAHINPEAKKGEQDIVLDYDAEPIQITLPRARRAAVVQKLSPLQMIAELKKRAADGTLTDEEREQLSDLGISL